MEAAATTESVSTPASSPPPTANTTAPQAEPVPTPAATTPPVAEAKKQDDDFSQRFAALTRKERAILDREKQFKQYQNDPTYKEYLQFKELKSNPRQNAMKLVELSGVPTKDFYENLTATILNDGEPSVELEVKSIKEQLARDKQDAEKRRVAEEQERVVAALDGYKRDIVGTIEKQADDFELMKHYAGAGSIDLAIEVASEYYDKNKVVLPANEACKLVETWLEAESKRLLTLKKLGVKPAEEIPLEKKDEPKIGGEIKPSINVQPKTLTNSNTVATVPTTQPSPDYLLDREKRLKWSAEKLKKAWEEHGKS